MRSVVIIGKKNIVQGDDLEIIRCWCSQFGRIGKQLQRVFRLVFAKTNIGEEVNRILGVGMNFPVLLESDSCVVELTEIDQRLPRYGSASVLPGASFSHSANDAAADVH